MGSEIQSAASSPHCGNVTLILAMRRGFLGRCPNCGRAPLFVSYLKQVQSCRACGAEFGHIRADDAAPWLTLIVVSHLFLPLIFFVNLGAILPFWLGVTGWAAFFCGVALVFLPRAQEFFIGVVVGHERTRFRERLAASQKKKTKTAISVKARGATNEQQILDGRRSETGSIDAWRSAITTHDVG
jgi:uncharacterized protein (DUF983 family)